MTLQLLQPLNLMIVTEYLLSLWEERVSSFSLSLFMFPQASYVAGTSLSPSLHYQDLASIVSCFEIS
jgi:hypothetical protein